VDLGVDELMRIDIEQPRMKPEMLGGLIPNFATT